MPYHLAIASTLENLINDGQVPIILSVHSFTPNFRGVKRPWSAAVLWDKDEGWLNIYSARFQKVKN